MMEGWKEYKIGDFASVTSSKRIYLKDYVPNGIPFYRSREVIEKYNGKEITNTLFISENRYNEIKLKFGVPKKRDILITSVGTIGIPYLVKDDYKFYFKDGNLTWIKDINENTFPEYIYYWIISPLGKGTLYNYLIGSSQKALTIESLKQIKIHLPPLPTQRRIAKILSAYDDLIENNLKRIKLLEEMAQIEFNNWYSENKDFEKVNLGSIIGHEIGGGWGVEEQSEEFSKPAYVIRGTDIDELPNGKLEKVPFRFHKKSNLASRKLEDGDIIFEVSGGSSYEGVAKTLLVTDDLLKQFDNAVMPASFCKLARPIKRIYSNFLFLFWRFLRNIKGTEVFEIRSASNIVNYNWTAFLKFQKIKKPSEAELEKFNRIVEPIYKQIYNLGNQNQRLKEARDILLPRLMTGMIDVDKIKI